MITTVITKPSRFFVAISNSIWLVFGLVISHIFTDFLVLTDNQLYIEAVIIVSIIILAFIFKRHIVIGKIEWNEDKIRIILHGSSVKEYTISDINFLSVNILSYVGANVGLTFLPNDGCDNELFIHNNERKNRIRFRLENREQAMGLINKLNRWKNISGKITYDKTII